jgi:tyrosyl-tRNA synthetase
MILQAYDFVELRGAMAASCRWADRTSGATLSTAWIWAAGWDQKQLYALTSPLLTTSSGAKMGKTAAGAVWLNADMLSPYDYWQYWRNTEDADVERFLKLFTTLPMDEIARLAALEGVEINEAKKVLANEATALLHGRDAAARLPRPRRRRSSKVVRAKTCRPSTASRAMACWRCSWRLVLLRPMARYAAPFRAIRSA